MTPPAERKTCVTCRWWDRATVDREGQRQAIRMALGECHHGGGMLPLITAQEHTCTHHTAREGRSDDDQ